MAGPLLVCGILSALVYVGTDLAASALYPGFSFTDQAVSELFAIGAPTARLVVVLFSISSILFLAFAFGVWQASATNRALRVMSLLFAASALNALILWNVFPMHMRGQAPSFTDTMHLALAANPFVLLSVIAGVFAFRNWFGFISGAVILVILALAAYAFRFAPALAEDGPTPGLGLSERGAQYVYQVWQIALAVILLQRVTRTPPAHP